MWHCERCGTRFGTRFAPIECCPRCRRRDGVFVPVHFKLFESKGAEAQQEERPAASRSPESPQR